MLTRAEEIALERIEEILKLDVDRSSPADWGEVQMAALNLCSSIYGSGSPQVLSIDTLRRQIWDSNYTTVAKSRVLINHLQGLLREVAAEIRSGRVRDLQQQARGEVFGDFLTGARSALTDGFKDVAAVLACGALEDALKRYAAASGLDVQDKDMSMVVSALKAAGLVKGPQGALLQGFVKIRNKAFHAQWESVDQADVQSVIGFAQEFLLTRFPASA